MKISVIIPTYRPKEYLWQCLNSLKLQTFSLKDFEIILVLNGCIEPYKTQISDFVNHNLTLMNVIFLCTEKAGVSNARNMGLDVARGDYLTFLDDDDYVSHTYLEELYAISSITNIGLAKQIAFTEGLNESQPYRLTNEFNDKCESGTLPFFQVRKTFSGPCAKLFHRNIISGRRYNENFKNGEDSLFMFLISDRFVNVSFTSPDAVYYRRYRADSAVTMVRSRNEIVQNCFKLISSYVNIWIKNPFKYNFYFFITRVLGAIRMAFR